MTGDWGNLDCPQCGCTHERPERVTTDCDAVIAALFCPHCDKSWERRVELWRYYGLPEELPSP
jgi:hypothetical protein